MIHIRDTDVGILYKMNNNYIILMTKHPKNYTNIQLLVDPLKDIIKQFYLTSVINIGSIGSNIFPEGTIVQVNKVVIENPEDFSLNHDYIEGKKMIIKTEKYTSMSSYISMQFQLPKEITNKYHIFGEDLFVILLIANQLNIPNMCLGSVTNKLTSNPNDGSKQYRQNGQSYALNTIKYLFSL
jgi:hypothetical protein